MPTLSILGSLLIIAATASPLFDISADDILPADEITINSASTSGSGCPRKAVSISISDDRTVVTLGFDEFQTYFGKQWGRADSDGDKTCLIRLNLHYPSGYTTAVVDTTYHGFAQLDSGVVGTFSSSYSFADASGSLTRQSIISGGGSYANGSVYTIHDVIPTSAVVKSACGGRNSTLGIRTRINLTAANSSASGALTDDDATVAFTQQVHFSWQTCN